MASTHTSKEYTGLGAGNLSWTYTIQSLKKEDIKVSVTNAGGTPVDVTNFTITGYTAAGGTILFNTTGLNSDVCDSDGSPKSDRIIRIYRQTEVATGSVGVHSPRHSYQVGSSIKTGDLNDNQKQALYSVYELHDQEIHETKIRDGAVTSAKIADGTIVNGDINASAEIEVSKLKDGTARQILQTDSGGTGVEWTSNVDVPGTLDVTGAVDFDSTLNVDGNSTLANVDINGGAIDGTSVGSTSASTGAFTTINASGTITGNVTGNLTGDVTGDVTGNVSGNAGTATKLATARTIAGVSFDGTSNISLNNNAITNGAGYITSTLVDEQVQDKVGAMFTGNTEIGITATYQDADGTIDLEVGTLNQDTTGNAATATALETARAISGVSFDGTSDITLNNNAITNGAGYITSSGSITGNAATATTATNATNVAITANTDTDETVYPTFVDASTGNRPAEVDTGLTYNPNSGVLSTTSVSGNLTGNVTGNVTGNADTATDLAAAAKITNSEQASHTANDTTYFTTSASDARYFNISTGDTIKDGDTFPDNDTTIATTAAINDRIVDLVDEVGGFVAIANENSFPTTNPDINDAAGTLVSIKALSENITTGSGVTNNNSIAQTTAGTAVNITGLTESSTYAAGYGMIVETTSTLNEYTFHRLVPKATEVTTVAGKATEIGRLGTEDAVSDMNTLGTTAIVSDMDTLADIAGNITTVAGIQAHVTTVSGIQADVTNVANDATDIGAVAAKADEIGRLGTADAVADLALLGTSAVVEDLNLLGTSDCVADMALLGDSAVIADMATIADTSNLITNIGTVAGIQAHVTTVGGISSDVTDVAGKATEIGRLGTEDAVADMAILGTTDVVADLNTLGTAAVVEDLNILGTADVVSDMNTLATTANVNNLNTVAGSIANVNTTATNIADVNNFAATYQIAGSAPATDGAGNSLAAGDLYFDTSASELKVRNAANDAWQGGVTATGNLVSKAGDTFTGAVKFPDGATGTPSITNASDEDTGIYFGADNEVDITVGGATKFEVNSTGVDITGDIVISGTVDGVDLQTLNSAVSANTAKVTNATHTGDVTGATSLTIENDAVTYAKMQNVTATDRVLGRDSSGAGIVEEIAPSALRTMLNVADGAEANVNADWNSSSGDSQILNKPTLAASATTDTTDASNIDSGTLPAARLPNHSAALLTSGTLPAARIADESITLAKLPHGDGTSNGKFLRSNNGADPTWETVSTDDTTYGISAADGDDAASEKIRITASSGGTDDVVIAASTGLSIARSSDTITLTNTVSDTTYTAGTGLTLSGTEFSVTALALTTVQTAANETAHLALTTQEGDVVVRSDENKSYVKNSGTAGTMADFTLLATPTDAVLSVNGNTGAITAAQIAAAVEAASDSNTFTDDDHSKLAGIEANATADQTDGEIQAIVGAMFSSNTETGITATYESGDGTIDLVVADQTPEGTAIKSTGETGTAKFLRVNGDNSCSWQVPPDTTTPADDSVTGAKLDISLVQGDVIYASGTDTLARLAKGSAGEVLKMNSGETAPEWGTAGVSISNDANNRLTTADGSSGLVGEANLTFDGSTLAVTGNQTTTLAVAAQGFEAPAEITANWSIAAANNAMYPGPMTIASGVSVTVPANRTLTIV